MQYHDTVGSLEALEKVAASKSLISVVGSMNADYTIVADRMPKPGETVNGGELRVLPGGKSGNQAVSAAKIGAHVRMFGAVGDDNNADFLLNSLQSAGVDTAHVQHVKEMQSGTTVITVDAQSGENSIVYAPGSNAQVTAAYIESVRDALLESKVLGLCLESPMETVTYAAQICHEHGVKVLLNNSPFVDTLPQKLIDASDILLVNEHEMAQLLHIDEPADGNWDGFDWNHAVDVMHDYGFDQAIVTLGSDGSVVLDRTQADPVCRIAPLRVHAVDTTGCGDAFMGTVLAGLAANMTLADAAALASFVSAYAATGYGAQASYGTAEEIRFRFEA